jgi:hypothetical protein
VERGCITVPAQAAWMFLVPAAIFKLSLVSGGSWILKQLMNTNHIPISEHGWLNKWLVRSATLINSSRQPLLPQFSNSQAVQESPRNACWGFLPLRIGGVHDHCSKEAKHTNTQYLAWFGKSPTSTGIVYIIRDRKRIQHTEKDHIHSTPIFHCYIGQ